MCPPPEGGKKRRKAYVSRGRARLENYRTMRWLDAERRERGMSLRDVAKILGYRNADRVGKYFRQQIVAGPHLVRRLARAVGVSPIEALWSSHYFGAVFEYLDQLYRLGWAWMRDDHVGLDQASGAHFLTYYATRGVSNFEGIDIEEPPLDIAQRYHKAEINNTAGVFRSVSLPKPMACAIFLAVAMFPRRGDVSRAAVLGFLRDLAQAADDMLPYAEVAKVPAHLYRMRRPLELAEKILPWRVFGKARLSIAAEYVHHWCDTVCTGYTDFARVALYEAGGFVGTHDNGENLWEWQTAPIPSVNDLRLIIKQE